MTRSRDLYAIPVLGRYGLTHGLLAWARCLIWCKQNDAKMLAPFWFKLRIGPYLRCERDKRNYFLLFHSGNAIGGISRLVTLVRARKVRVGPEWPVVPDFHGQVIVKFYNALKDNERKSFAQVLGHGPYLRRELLAMTRQKYHPAPATKPFVAIHVRLGDFTKVPVGSQVSPGQTNARLPIDWYGDRLTALRSALGREIPAMVFSDGSDADLATLLGMPGVTRAPRQASVTDLLAIGEGAAVIASGSGFSLWGAFLGGAPRIAFPGQSIVPIDADPNRDIESDFGEPIPQGYLSQVRARLGE